MRPFRLPAIPVLYAASALLLAARCLTSVEIALSSEGVNVAGTASSWSTDTNHGADRRVISERVVNHGASRVTGTVLLAGIVSSRPGTARSCSESNQKAKSAALCRGM